MLTWQATTRMAPTGACAAVAVGVSDTLRESGERRMLRCARIGPTDQMDQIFDPCLGRPIG